MEPYERQGLQMHITSVPLYKMDLEAVALIRDYLRATSNEPFSRSRTAAIRFALRHTVETLAREIRAYQKRQRTLRRRKKLKVLESEGEK
jgi:hypothetical protein